MSNLPPEKAALLTVSGLVGGQARMAELLGYTDRRNVWPWFSGRRVPADHCPALERAAHGTVTCEQLRPDVRWHRVPDAAWPWHPAGRPLIDVARQSEVTTQEAQRAA